MAIESLLDTISLACSYIGSLKWLLWLVLFIFAAAFFIYLLDKVLSIADSYFQELVPFLDFGTTGKALCSGMSDTPVFKADHKETWFPRTPNKPLFTESKYETRFESISFFRSREPFHIEKALQDYHREPIAYALALAQLNTEVFKATRRRNRDGVIYFIHSLAARRRDRDMVGIEDYDSGNVGLKFSHVLQYWRSRLSMLLDGHFEKNLKKRIEAARFLDGAQLDRQMLHAWMLHFMNFVKNVNLFCQHAGSEVDDLAPPHETIKNLRKFASDRRQELAPLLEVNAKSNKELTSYKRINAALQTRYTIEKLVFELPDTAQYDVTGSGPKWERLWHQIWQDASKNVDNPFHTLWTQSTGQHARDNIQEKGRNLFADMSGEIHGYDQGQRDKLDYEHFDASARKIAKILHDEPIINPRTGDVAWNKEIRKYPVAWPDKDNLALSKLQRLQSRVENLDQQLQTAKENRDEEKQKQREVEERRERRVANDAAQNDADADTWTGTLYLNTEEQSDQ